MFHPEGEHREKYQGGEGGTSGVAMTMTRGHPSASTSRAPLYALLPFPGAIARTVKYPGVDTAGWQYRETQTFAHFVCVLAP